MPIGVQRSGKYNQSYWAPGPRSIRAWRLGVIGADPPEISGTLWYIAEDGERYVSTIGTVERVFGKAKFVSVLVAQADWPNPGYLKQPTRTEVEQLLKKLAGPLGVTF